MFPEVMNCYAESGNFGHHSADQAKNLISIHEMLRFTLYLLLQTLAQVSHKFLLKVDHLYVPKVYMYLRIDVRKLIFRAIIMTKRVE